MTAGWEWMILVGVAAAASVTAVHAQSPAPDPAVGRIVFMGDSITEGWPHHVPAFWDTPRYVNRGISGQTTPQMLLRFRQDVIALAPDTVVILAGTNDIAENTGPIPLELVAGHIASMVDLATANGIAVVLCSVLPAAEFPWRPGLSPATKIPVLNAMLEALAREKGLVWVDYHAAMTDGQGGLRAELTYDGVHPNAAGYAVMEQVLRAASVESE